MLRRFTTVFMKLAWATLQPTLGMQVVGVAVLMAMLGGGVVGLVVTDRARSALRNTILTNSLVAADLASTLSASYMGEAEAAARELASRPALGAAARDGNLNSLTRDLERWNVEHANLSVFVSGLDGVTRVTSLRDKSAVGSRRFSDDDWFQGAMRNGQPFTGAPGISPVTNKPSIPYAIPLRDETGTVQGVLTVSIRLDALSYAITSNNAGTNARVSLVDRASRLLLAHPDKTLILTKLSSSDAVALRLTSGERGVLEDTSSDGQRVLSAFGPVSGSPWAVLIQQPSAEAFAPLDAMDHDAMRLVAATVLVAIALGTVIALRIGRPLRRLRATAEAMANGDLDRRAGLDRQDETGEVGRAFDRMADRLQASIGHAQEREAGIRAVMDSVADAILTFDEHGHVDSCNLAAERLFGYTVAELVGRPIADLVPEATLHETRNSQECAGRRQDGSIMPLELATSETWLDGHRRLTVVARDISDRKHADRQREALAQSEKLRALGQMATGIAHDLNQSLMLVATYSELARQALEHDPPKLDEVRDLFSTATQAALDGGETVKRLLLFTRAPVVHDRQRADLTSIVRDAVQLTAPRWRDDAQADGRPISLHIEAQGHPLSEGSPARLREVMTNLIFNAVDALPDGGTIQLRVAAEGEHAIIEVSDSGLGMTAEVQARVFEPFFTTKGDAGTGLGMAMVFGIVEQHGGRIDVRSAPGAGTTIRISLPLILPSALPQPAPMPVAAPLPPRPLRVLTVDDEPAMTKAVVRMLRPGGHTISTADSAEAALEQLAANTFDVVVSDMGMGPGMNGWELAAEVRQRWPAVRFVLATGWGAAIDPVEARSKGVQAVLAKPYLVAELTAALVDPILADAA